METRIKYHVFGELHNADNDGFAYLGEKDHFDSLDDAKKKYHNYLSTYINTNPFDRVMFMVIDSFGNVFDKEVWTKAVPEPEPEPTPEIIDEIEE